MAFFAFAEGSLTLEKQISINKYQLIGWGNDDDERTIHTQHDSVLSFEIVQESNFLFLHYYSSEFGFRIRCRLLR